MVQAQGSLPHFMEPCNNDVSTGGNPFKALWNPVGSAGASPTQLMANQIQNFPARLGRDVPCPFAEGAFIIHSTPRATAAFAFTF
jgi:hypothetical protein